MSTVSDTLLSASLQDFQLFVLNGALASHLPCLCCCPDATLRNQQTTFHQPPTNTNLLPFRPSINSHSKWPLQLWTTRTRLVTASMVRLASPRNARLTRHSQNAIAPIQSSPASDTDIRPLPDEAAPRYERDNRSASPRSDAGGDGGRRRSASPGAER